MLTCSTTDYCSHNTWESFGYAKLISLIPLIAFKLILWDFQIAQFLRSKNRQKVINKMPDFCENCNPYSSYHTTPVGECLVDISFAEICKLTLCTFLKIFYQFEKWEFIACSNRQFEQAVLYVRKSIISLSASRCCAEFDDRTQCRVPMASTKEKNNGIVYDV